MTDLTTALADRVRGIVDFDTPTLLLSAAEIMSTQERSGEDVLYALCCIAVAQGRVNSEIDGRRRGATGVVGRV